MMSFSRRTAMKMLGASPFAAKAAASKLAAEGQMAKMMGIPNIPSAGSIGAKASVGVPSYITKSMVAASQFVKTFGLPPGIEEQMRDRAKYVGALDPDIASKRSWSMNVKIMTQRERNFRRDVERIHKSSDYRISLDGVEALLNDRWPWS